MPTFLLIFFAIYGAMHSYFFWKVCVAFPGLGHFRFLLAGVLFLLLLTPMLAHFLDRWRCVTLTKGVGYVSYAWMVAIFWFCALGVVWEGWNLGVRLVAVAAPGARAGLLPPRLTLAVSGGLIAVAFCWGLAEASGVRLQNITVEVPSLPGEMKELRLVQIADLHLSTLTDADRVARVVKLIQEARPDILVSTGDLVDAPLRDIEQFAGLLRDIRPPLGKFAVFGNHEFYTGLEESLAFHQAAGFQLLRGQSVTIGGAVRIAGVDDQAGGHGEREGPTDEDAILPPKGQAPATVLLKHQPRVTESSLGRFQLQLSGHTHGGQIFPFHLVIGSLYRYYRGSYDLPEGSRLYVSRGTGTWGAPVRVLSPPEVTVITLRLAASQPAQTGRPRRAGP